MSELNKFEYRYTSWLNVYIDTSMNTFYYFENPISNAYTIKCNTMIVKDALNIIQE